MSSMLGAIKENSGPLVFLLPGGLIAAATAWAIAQRPAAGEFIMLAGFAAYAVVSVAVIWLVNTVTGRGDPDAG